MSTQLLPFSIHHSVTILKGSDTLPGKKQAAMNAVHQVGMAPIGQVGAQIAQVAARQALPVNHCPMDNETIEENSVLESLNLEPMPDIRRAMKAKTKEAAVRKLAANFAAGGLTTGGDDKTQLDGMYPLPNFTIWDWLLENLLTSMKKGTNPLDIPPEGAIPSKEFAAVESLHKGIKNLLDFSKDLVALENGPHNEKVLSDVATKYAQKIADLQPGQSLPLYGGWSNEGGGSGHALIYEFVKTSDKTYNILLFTSTDYQLTSHFTAGDKNRIKPVVCYAGVPEHVICFNGDGVVRPPFIQHLMELKALKKWDSNTVIDEEDVLEAFDHLTPYKKELTPAEVGTLGGQRAGSCVPSSTKAWKRHTVADLGSYKLLMFHLNLYLMVGTYRNLTSDLSNDTEEGAISRRLLVHMARNHIRKALKAAKGVATGEPLIDANLVERAQATAYDIIQRVEFHENAIREARKANKVLSDLSDLDIESQRKTRIETRALLSTTKGDNESRVAALSLPNLDFKIRNLQDLKAHVNRLKSQIRNISVQGNKEVFAAEFHHLVDQLPMPEKVKEEDQLNQADRKSWTEKMHVSFFDELNPEEMKEALKTLHELADVYGSQSRLMERDSVTCSQATVLTFHVLIHYLAVKIDNEKLKETPGETE